MLPSHDVTSICAFDVQVLYSLQGPVLWLGVRRSLQTGGWQCEVSKALVGASNWLHPSFRQNHDSI